MPELPDVELFKRYVDSTALYQTIADIEVKYAGLLDGISASRFRESLKGTRFRDTARHGKHLFIGNDNGQWVMLHFGMTGFLKYYKSPEKEPAHNRLLFKFDNDYHLTYDCRRKLGRISLTLAPETFVHNEELGPDALLGELDADRFAGLLHKSRAMIKSFLMNQRHIAGIGNIYSDEILFQAGIHPKVKSNQVNHDRAKKIHGAMNRVLKKAIATGANPDRFPSTFIIPHRREGEDCPQCNGKIKKATIAGRTGYFCPRCQKQ